jgi:hypothetical protein
MLTAIREFLLNVRTEIYWDGYFKGLADGRAEAFREMDKIFEHKELKEAEKFFGEEINLDEL